MFAGRVTRIATPLFLSSTVAILLLVLPSAAEGLSNKLSNLVTIGNTSHDVGINWWEWWPGLCPVGLIPYLDTNGRPRECIIEGSSEDCPGAGSYICRRSSSSTARICCGAAGQCPSGHQRTTDADGRITACSPTLGATAAVCPAGATCQTAIGGSPGHSLCCRSASFQYICPSGDQPYPSASNPVLCTNNPGVCPTGTVCQISSNSGSVDICCGRGAHNNGGCPSGWTLQNGVQQYCQPGLVSCRQSGASCLQNVLVANQFLCCVPGTSPTQRYQCSYGGTPVVVGTTNQFCTGNPSLCTGGATCQQAANFPGTYICCRGGNGGGGGTVGKYICPNQGAVEYISGSTQRQCNQYSPNACSSGFSCKTASNAPNVQICCTNGNGGTDGTMCPVGTPVLDSGLPRQCTVSTNNCPTGASCLRATNQPIMSICCYGASYSQVYQCPGGAQALKNAAEYHYCNINIHNTCPTGFQCRSASNVPQVAICCASAASEPQCPNGAYPYRDGVSIRYCNVIAPGTCPTGYACQLATNIAGVSLCCSTSLLQYQCPGNMVPFKGSNGVAIFCNPAQPANCPGSSQCLQAVNRPGSAICCTGGTNINLCPNSRPALLLSSGQPQICTGPGMSCAAAGYSCQVSPTTGSFVCCATSASSEPQCANGAQMYQPFANQMFTCNPRSQAGCPSRYDCLLSTSRSKYVCCLRRAGTSHEQAGCPAGWNAHNGVGGLPLRCNGVNDVNTCPSGYSCAQSSVGGTFLCCRYRGSSLSTMTHLQCYSGVRRYSTSVGSPMMCNLQVSSCPSGNSCQASTQANTFICCSTVRYTPTIPTTTTRRTTTSSVRDRCPSSAQLFQPVRYCSQSGSSVGCPVDYVCRPSVTRAGISVCCRAANTDQSIASAVCGTARRPEFATNGAPKACGVSGIACNIGSTCMGGMISGRRYYFCCRSPQCPNGVTIGDPPQTCLLGRYHNSCPQDFACTLSKNIPEVSICCQKTGGGGSGIVSSVAQCIARTTLLIDGVRPRTCTTMTSGGCPRGFECSSHTTTGEYLCCAVALIDGGDPLGTVCPNGRDAYRDPVTKRYHYCENTNFACPGGYVCKRMLNAVNSASRYLCCSSLPSCQPGWMPYVNPQTRRPQACSPFQANQACSPHPGPPYRCQQSTVPNSFICCVESAKNIVDNVNNDAVTDSDTTKTIETTTDKGATTTTKGAKSKNEKEDEWFLWSGVADDER